MKSRVHLGRALFYCLHCINRTCVSSHFNNFLSPEFRALYGRTHVELMNTRAAYPPSFLHKC